LVIRPVQTGWFWPDQAFRDLVVCMFIFAILVSLILFSGHGNAVERPAPANPEEPRSLYETWAHAGQDGLGANLDAPADPEQASYPARPEWYFLFLFQLLKYFTGDKVLVGTVFIPNGAFVLLLILPLLGFGRMRRFGHVVSILVVLGLLGGAAALTLIAMQEDSVEDVVPTPNLDFLPLSDEQKQEVHDFKFIPLTDKQRKNARAYQHRAEVAHHEAKRAVELAMAGNPVDGSRELVRKDPVTKGPGLFQANCAACHTYTPVDPAKDPVQFNDPKLTYKASDLAGYASEGWILGLLTNPSDPKYFGRTELTGMKKWREAFDKKRVKLTADEKAQQDESLKLIAKFVAQQAKPKKDRNPEIEKAGKTAFEEAFDSRNCSSCHKIDEPGPSAAPNLTDYGSASWLRLMIMTPDSPLRYGTKNKMPAFRDPDSVSFEVQKAELEQYRTDDHAPSLAQLSEVNREVLIRWLTHDPRAVFGGTPISGPAAAQEKK
jgi:ubiquinol-cytochrome c reductase cytochrome b subunit